MECYLYAFLTLNLSGNLCDEAFCELIEGDEADNSEITQILHNSEIDPRQYDPPSYELAQPNTLS